MTQALIEAQRRSPKYIERRPLRWYDVPVIAAGLALPFVQWFAFLRFQTRLSFMIPLAITASLMFVVAALNPRFVPAQLPNSREAGLRVGVIAVVLILALVLPSSGTIILLRRRFSRENGDHCDSRCRMLAGSHLVRRRSPRN